MKFLCHYHKERFLALPLARRQDLWLSWMEGALSHYQQRRLREAVQQAGCAFDLGCASERFEPSNMHVEVTLATVFLQQALTEYGIRDEVAPLRSTALEVLARCEQSPGVARCQKVLCDRHEQCAFFQDYLNWPFALAESASGAWADT